MIKGENLLTYCYHCGKILKTDKEDEMFYAGNIHSKCNRERRKKVLDLKKLRWEEMMKDPKIKKRINKIDKKILKKEGLI